MMYSILVVILRPSNFEYDIMSVRRQILPYLICVQAFSIDQNVHAFNLFVVDNGLSAMLSVAQTKHVYLSGQYFPLPYVSGFVSFFLDINECDNNPCQNGGSCVDGIDSYACKCQTGFYGAQCQTSK